MDIWNLLLKSAMVERQPQFPSGGIKKVLIQTQIQIGYSCKRQNLNTHVSVSVPCQHQCARGEARFWIANLMTGFKFNLKLRVFSHWCWYIDFPRSEYDWMQVVIFVIFCFSSPQTPTSLQLRRLSIGYVRSDRAWTLKWQNPNIFFNIFAAPCLASNGTPGGL